MIDVVRRIQRFNAGRDPERLKLKFRNMRESPFVFLRGTAHLFYDRLPRARVFAEAPAGWICGDLHLENFGSFKGDNRLVYFDLNDFDEAALAPVTWDLARFLTSVLVGADSLHAGGDEALDLCRAFLDAYCAALGQGKARWVERETADGPVRELLDGLRERSRPTFLDGRTECKGKRRTLRLNTGKALPVTEGQRERVRKTVGKFASAQPEPAFFEVLDVARRIAGSGSLGVDRYVVLVEGKGSPDGNYLLDIKEALPTSLAPHLKLRQPVWKSEAHRVVELQRRMQAIPMAFLRPLRMGGRDYVLRGLQPTEDRVTLDRTRQSLRQMEGVMRVMGEIVAWAQLRSSGRDGSATADELIDFGSGRGWRKDLMAAAQQCAVQVAKDWTIYSAAYDDKAFGK